MNKNRKIIIHKLKVNKPNKSTFNINNNHIEELNLKKIINQKQKKNLKIQNQKEMKLFQK